MRGQVAILDMNDTETQSTDSENGGDDSVASSGLRLMMWISFCFPLNLGTTAFLHEVIQVREEIAFLIALVIVSIVNFIGLRRFVYRQTSGSLSAQFGAFAVSTVVFRTLEYLGFLIVFGMLGWHYLLGVIAVMGLSTLVKHFVYRFAIFRRAA
ncbi:MAG: hypothetical protein CMJ78_03335 [Planctomycetaceae bacterium]|nr:hypothetical protein [Planctomycetaceae bacterium]